MVFYKRESRRLKKENEHLRSTNKLLGEALETLRERIRRMEEGKRCEGSYCKYCVNSSGEQLEIKDGVLKTKRTLCLKDVPCPDFHRQGAALCSKEAAP